jgi:hypothetical protein
MIFGITKNNALHYINVKHYFNMNENKLDPRLARVKEKLFSVGLAIPGTIRVTSLKCGRSWCACAKKGGALHGPYYFWNRKVKGKLTSKSISESKLALYRRWISNREEIEELLRQLLEIGQEIAAETSEIMHKVNSKKRTSAKRGK